MILKGSVRMWEALGVGLALAVAAAALLQWGIEGVVHSRRTQTVPDLKGRSISAALDLLAPLDIGLRKEASEFNSSVPMASVLRQDPPAGTVVREGKVVRVVVSQGGETVLAPAIVGLPLRNAEMLLRQSQLVLGEVSESYSLSSEKGVVLSQDPKAEASVERGVLVNVTVSGGKPPVGVNLMPDFVRKDIGAAQSWASSLGVTLVEKKDASSPFAYGTILSQDPAADSPLSGGAKVSVVVSGRAGKAGQAGPAVGALRYEVPQGGGESLVRIVVSDKYGERELFRGLRPAGSKIELPIQETGGAHVRIFLNGILVDERDL